VLNGQPAEELVFRSPKGTVLRVGNARPTWWNAAVIEAELPTGFHPHELLHTAASLATSPGVNIKAVQRMLGHKSAAMTLDTYADLLPAALDAVAGALNQAAPASSVSTRAGQPGFLMKETGPDQRK